MSSADGSTYNIPIDKASKHTGLTHRIHSECTRLSESEETFFANPCQHMGSTDEASETVCAPATLLVPGIFGEVDVSEISNVL